MTHFQRVFVAAACLCILSGCGSSSKSESPPEPPPVKDTVFGDLVSAKDKAKGVQDSLNAQKEERDRQMQAEEEKEAR